jgi:hypothetical protein
MWARRRPRRGNGPAQRRRSFSLGTAAVSAGAPESELTRHVKEMNFLSAHRSSNPICPAMQSVSATCRGLRTCPPSSCLSVCCLRARSARRAPPQTHDVALTDSGLARTAQSKLARESSMVAGGKDKNFCSRCIRFNFDNALPALSFYRDGSSGKTAMRSPRTEPSQSSLAT